ncbi:hypothetical protein IQ13_1525 [Lacibacter cauensis]|uniref:Uncharacterized protein n=1 Tax=Lacibacter cauensis TaxID=510947 RepID=A0A562SQK3_9BACT|nr:hypothetical protein [Lacibacter cauensis]TWI83413.1 hypothetical protein IQ13_1525 [Lacibacter cauensis]
MMEPNIDFTDMPFMHLFGIKILEPFTVLTNIFIAAACFYACFHLRAKKLNQTLPQRLLFLFFLLMGISTLAGGVIGHAFLYATGMYGKIPGWYTGMAAVAAFERAAIIHSRPLMNKQIGRFFSWFNYAEILTFMILSLITLRFFFVILHAMYGLLVVVFCFELYVYSKTKDAALKHIFYATAWGAAALLCHALQLSIHYWFNYNDVSHMAMIAAILHYYKAAAGMQTELKNEEIIPLQQH